MSAVRVLGVAGLFAFAFAFIVVLPVKAGMGTWRVALGIFGFSLAATALVSGLAYLAAYG